MDAKQNIELTIRTATLIKTLSQLVGRGDERIAKMIFAQAVDQFAEVGRFLDRCIAEGKKGEHEK